jgi:plastocyanin
MGHALDKRTRTSIIGLALALLLLAPLIASCRAAASPAVNIIAPAEGGIIASSNVTVTIAVDNFGLTDNLTTTGGQREGHVIYYLDVTPPVHQGRTAMTQRGSYTAATATTCTWQDVRPGTHVLGVQLVTGGDEPLIVPEVVTVTVEVVTPPRQPVKIALVATEGVFEADTVSVPAGAEVLLTFANEDDTPHNFSLYESAAAQQALFRGEPVTGPKTVVYRFRAPAIPGDYFFRSDESPDTMTGTLTVTPK